MPGHVISGMVRDQSGQPLAEATVAFASGPEPLPDVAALTGEDGRFRLTAPVPGSYSIACTLPDGTGHTQTIEVAPDAESSVVFDLSIDT